MVEPSLDASYGALGHEIRRSMLDLLRDDELRVTEFAEPFDISLAGASKHIRVLEDAGSSGERSSGASISYRSTARR